MQAWRDAVRIACDDGTYSEFDSDAPMCQTCPRGTVDSDGDPVTPCDTCD
eukprot:COSAG02_NODE_22249_length_758_cov_1.376328_2_plen_49_part_01